LAATALVLMGCAGRPEGSSDVDGGGGRMAGDGASDGAGGDVDAGCRPEAEKLTQYMNCCGEIVVEDAQGPVVFFYVAPMTGLDEGPAGIYAKRPGQPRVQVVTELSSFTAVAAVDLPGGGGGFLLCGAQGPNASPVYGCQTLGADLHPASGFDARLGWVVRLLRLDGQLFAFNGATSPLSTTGPGPQVQPVDETGVPQGSALAVSCGWTGPPGVGPLLASSSTRLACLTYAPAGCGQATDHFRAPDCQVAVHVYDASGLVFSTPPTSTGPLALATTLAVRKDEVLVVPYAATDAGPLAAVALPLAADGTPGQPVTLPVELSWAQVVGTSTGYAMLAATATGTSRLGYAGPSPVLIALGTDGQVVAGPARVVDEDPGYNEMASQPLGLLATSGGQLAVLWEDYVDTGWGARLLLRQVPEDLSGLTPVDGPLPSRACSPLPPRPPGAQE
jgi:hypothetical protein